MHPLNAVTIAFVSRGDTLSSCDIATLASCTPTRVSVTLSAKDASRSMSASEYLCEYAKLTCNETRRHNNCPYGNKKINAPRRNREADRRWCPPSARRPRPARRPRGRTRAGRERARRTRRRRRNRRERPGNSAKLFYSGDSPEKHNVHTGKQLENKNKYSPRPPRQPSPRAYANRSRRPASSSTAPRGTASRRPP